MVDHIQLEAGATLVDRLARPSDPVGAIGELIWNSLDADANSVEVRLLRNAADGVIGVSVKDDGHGMSPEHVRTYFKRVGDSWKRGIRVSQGERRPLHGQAGQGRLRAFALGDHVVWTTVADDITGRRIQTVARAHSAAKDSFDCSQVETPNGTIGTIFEATGFENLNRLDGEKAFERLTREFAPYLMTRPAVLVRYNGRKLDPSVEIEFDDSIPLEWADDGRSYAAHLRVIQWRSGSDRSLLLCDDAGVPVDGADLRLPAPDFTYTAYVLWNEMPSHRNEWLLADLDRGNSVVGGLLTSALGALENHFSARRDERRRQTVQGWKEKGTYPYAGEPGTEEERLERAAFDVLSTSIRDHIPTKKQQQRLTLGLLRDSFQQRPANVSELLKQYVELASTEHDQLDRLLNRTGLSKVIGASTSVSNRLEFIAALDLMVYDPEANRLVGERAHLHKILENELWIFGEEYNQMISERGLSAALDRHLGVLGQGQKRLRPVRRLDGSSGRLDLLLSAAATEHDRNRHLVVELKAPKVEATEQELNQIKSYAKAVVADPRFANSATVWDFWLVTTSMNEDVRQEASQRNRPRGLVFEPESATTPETKVRVWVRTWDQIIEDCRRRLAFFQERLERDPSMEEGREYLSRVHGDVIPEGIFVEGRRSESATVADGT